MQLTEALERIDDMPRLEAVALLEKLGLGYPTDMKLALIRLVVKKRLMELTQGELEPVEQTRLFALVAKSEQVPSARHPKKVLQTYRRVWHGTLYEVEQLPDGRYVYASNIYNSLSAVAKVITGRNENGIRFFGSKHYGQH